MVKVIQYDRSVIPACDVSTLDDFKQIVEATHDVEGIGGYKVGLELGLGHGLPAVVETARTITDLPIIYDHQKAGTDVPFTGENFARVCSKAGVDAIILFPQSGPETQQKWVEEAHKHKLKVIGGGEMTHPKYKRSEGGYLADESLEEMYLNFAKNNVTNFVVPGNKPDKIRYYRKKLESIVKTPIFFAPGFVAQGGEITEAAKAAGDFWHAIVGRAIRKAEDMHAAAKEMTSKLR